ncbi:hypothetical protein NPS42_22460 [Pseudomonas putida]|uniref:hypothetical protein n=2 Tax=Pseudomonas TaxID=286 RepID=UPI0023647DEE|nr:hypothetical protein [Pseudomonas putida]MDD2028558.1 hypothetical protein [Pseudomonas putida]HDS1768045.1 hypothetical protein [Pseudomonas putida]
MSTEIPSSDMPKQALLTQAEKLMSIVIATAGLLIFAWLAICVLASAWLTFQVPITNEDMRNASFLSPRVGLYWHGSVMGGLLALYGLGQLLSLRVAGFFLVVLGMSFIFATSEVSALRQGILDGDMKIGCFSYESLECRKMLKLPEGDSQSIYRNPSQKREGGYAPWYEPIQAHLHTKVTALLPNTIPGVAFLQSPVIAAFHVGKLQNVVEAQRSDVSKFRASVTQ